MRWERVAPASRVLRVCGSCHDAFRRAADDRSTTPEDDHRLVRMTLAVGGETWRAGDLLYWYRDGPREQAGPCRAV